MAKKESAGNGARKATATLTLALGALVTKFKLYRIEQRDGTVPLLKLRHACGNDANTVTKCPHCAALQHSSRVQQKGAAAGRRGPGEVPVLCRECGRGMEKALEVVFCPNEGMEVKAKDFVRQLELDGKVVTLTEAQFTDWLKLAPVGNEMIPVGLVAVNAVPSVIRQEAFQIVPEAGNALRVALWQSLLGRFRLGLVARFNVKKKQHVGFVYVAKVQGRDYLFMQYLLPFDDMELDETVLPSVTPELTNRLYELTDGMRYGTLDTLDGPATLLVDPQRAAFREIFMAAERAGEVSLARHSVLPGERLGLAEALAAETEAPKPPRAPREKNARPKKKKASA